MSHPFAEAVLAHDLDAMTAQLAESVTFTSPVAFTPYEGKAMTSLILGAVLTVFHDFRYVREIVDADNAVLEFRATVDGLDINGVDILHFDADGLIDDFTVMVRPLSAATRLAERMAVAFAAAQRAGVPSEP